MYFCFLPLILIQPTTENLWITKLATTKKKLGPWNTHDKKIRIYEIPTRKILDPRITHQKKFRAYEIPKTARDLKNSAHLFSTLYIFQFIYSFFCLSISHSFFGVSISFVFLSAIFNTTLLSISFSICFMLAILLNAK